MHTDGLQALKGTMGTEEQFAKRNIGRRGSVSAEEHWSQKNSKHRGTASAEEKWALKNNKRGGIVSTKGTVSGHIQRNGDFNSGHRGRRCRVKFSVNRVRLTPVQTQDQNLDIFNHYPEKSRGISPDT